MNAGWNVSLIEPIIAGCMCQASYSRSYMSQHNDRVIPNHYHF